MPLPYPNHLYLPPAGCWDWYATLSLSGSTGSTKNQTWHFSIDSNKVFLLEKMEIHWTNLVPTAASADLECSVIFYELDAGGSYRSLGLLDGVYAYQNRSRRVVGVYYDRQVLRDKPHIYLPDGGFSVDMTAACSGTNAQANMVLNIFGKVFFATTPDYTYPKGTVKFPSLTNNKYCTLL